MPERSQLFFLTLIAYLFLPFSRFAQSAQGKKEYRILIVQPGKIGDLVCTTPLFAAVKRLWRDAELGVAVPSLTIPLITLNSSIDTIWQLDSRGFLGKLRLIRRVQSHSYQWVLILMPSPWAILLAFLARIPLRAMTVVDDLPRFTRILLVFLTHHLPYQLHTPGFEHYQKMLNLIAPIRCDEPREVFFDKEAYAKTANFLKTRVDRKNFLVGISVTAGKHNKEWPVERLSTIANLLIEHYHATIIWIGSDTDATAIEQAQALVKAKEHMTSTAGACTLSELPALLARLKLFIAVDNGPLYIADALGIPVVDIAGPADIRSQSPQGKYVIIQAPGIPPCLTLMAAPETHERDPAATAITVDMVWRGIQELVGKYGILKTDSAHESL
ncbi:MAG: glycosyltransferase family 9 protein [Parcubacteria group bacterium]|nr:glycosyltransferase family 9 protein [Parcubacteria group bacterium]